MLSHGPLVTSHKGCRQSLKGRGGGCSRFSKQNCLNKPFVKISCLYSLFCFLQFSIFSCVSISVFFPLELDYVVLFNYNCILESQMTYNLKKNVVHNDCSRLRADRQCTVYVLYDPQYMVRDPHVVRQKLLRKVEKYI